MTIGRFLLSLGDFCFSVMGVVTIALTILCSVKSKVILGDVLWLSFGIFLFRQYLIMGIDKKK